MLKNLITEKRNNRTMNLDEMSAEEFLRIMNDEDEKVAKAVRERIPIIAKAVESIITSFKNGGRLIYVGAGTSGRIGLLDAVESPPTFGTHPEQIIGLIAGGEKAFVKAVEGAEDRVDFAEKDLKSINLNRNDIVVGISASGRTPYVEGALYYANRIGASTIAISCNINSKIGKIADTAIEVDCGPEVLTGSTRLKAGTAQKLICNMLSTASMIGMGKTFGNLMVDLRPTNTKLEERAKIIIMQATSCDYATAEKYLKLAENRPKSAIVMLLAGASFEEANRMLAEADGFISRAIKFKKTCKQ